MSFLMPKPPKPTIVQAPAPIAPPAAPTIDQAAQNAEDELRRKRRKGRGAYVFGGKAPPGPIAAGTKTLVGQ